MKPVIVLCFLVIPLIINSCKPGPGKSNLRPAKKIAKTVTKSVPAVIDILPYDDVPPGLLYYTYSNLIKICSHVRILQSRPLPTSAFYTPRNRYRADSLIRQLAAITPPGHTTLALTSRDISAAKGDVADWGIMGLGYCPGEACIASTFRLNKSNLKEQLFKVAIHELGHTQGLDHCPVRSCFMRDAEGKNPTDEEVEFCPTCRKALIKAGWSL